MTETLTISVGAHARDQHWKPWTGTQLEFLEKFFSEFRYGQKDGACIVPGHLVGGDRGSNLTIANYLVMLDHDNGITFDDVCSKIAAVSLRAIVWTTHSNMKMTTDLGQGGIVAHRRKKRFDETVSNIDVVRDYLNERKQWTPEMLASISDVEDVLDPKKGMQVRVTHGPMPKVRSLFFLEKPFAFTEPGMVQKDRVAEWKDRIKGFAYQLKLPMDSACQDPAHLMYLPACQSKGTEEINAHEIRTLDGAECNLQFDFVRYTEVASAEDVRGERRTQARATTFNTLGLGSFIRRAGPADSFRASEWFRDVSGQEPRRVADGIKYHFECPNDAEHSNAGDPKDTAFFVQDASPMEQRTWMLHCRHDSCISKFAGDRARLLDHACEAFGITDANDLLPYTDTDVLGGDGAGDYDALGDIETLIDEVTKDTPPAAIQLLVNHIVRYAPDPITKERRKEKLAKNASLKLRILNAMMKEVVPVAGPVLPRTFEDVPGADEFDREAPTPPTDEAIADGVLPQIWKEWAHEDKLRVLAGVIEQRNTIHKIIFLQSDGQVVQPVVSTVGVLFAVQTEIAQWANICYALGIHFMSASKLESQEPFKTVISQIARKVDWNLPIVERAVEVPMFGEDGSLETEKGYHEGARVYLDPRIEFLPVPDVVSDDDLDEALATFDEVSADFPFTDVFGGGDPLPIRNDDGTPNFNRGVSSRANFYAMLLQPFARSMIGKNATPMFFIDKAEKGTGANYLANILGYMLYGTPMPPQVISESEDELKKTITSSLYSGQPTIFFDNLNHELSSQSLAAALTSGVWTDRLLGKSQILRLPVSALWMLAANNGKISEELRRRVVPICLDAQLADPAHQRPRNYYHIRDLPRWCEDNRQKLIWAAHVLIRHYTVVRKDLDRLEDARGMYPYEPLQSFYRWTEVMGDILACAGVNGFLENVPAYRDTNKGESKEGTELFFGELWARYGTEPFTLPEALDILQKPFMAGLGELAGGSSPDPRFGFSFPRHIQKDATAEKIQALGMYFSKLRGKVYQLEEEMQVQIVHCPRDTRKGSRWHLVKVHDKINLESDLVEEAQ